MNPPCHECSRPSSRCCIHHDCNLIPFICLGFCQNITNSAVLKHDHNGQSKIVSFEQVENKISQIQQKNTNNIMNEIKKKVNLIVGDLNNLVERCEKMLTSNSKIQNQKNQAIIKNIRVIENNHYLTGKDMLQFLYKQQTVEDKLRQQSNKIIIEQIENIIKVLESIQIGSILNEAKSQQHYQKAIKLCQNFNFNKAYLEYQNAYKANPCQLSIAELLSGTSSSKDFKQQFHLFMNRCYERASEYLLLNKYQDALVDLNKITKLSNIYDSDIYFSKGLAYASTGQNDLAIENYNKAIEYKHDQMYYFHRGLLYEKLNQYQAALDNYSQAIKISPQNHKIRYQKAKVLMIINQSVSSLNQITQAINFNCHKSQYYYFRSNIYKSQGNLDLALHDLDKAIELDSTIDKYYLHRAIIYKILQRFEESFSDFNKSIQLNNTATVFKERGQFYFKLSKFKEAFLDFAKARQLDNTIEISHNHLAKIYFQLQQYQKSIDHWSKVVENNPISFSAFIYRGLSYQKLQQYQNALLDYDKAIQLNCTEDLPFKQKSYIYLELKQNQKALQSINKAIQLSPTYNNYHIKGCIYYCSLQYLKSLENLNKSIQLNSEFVDNYSCRALVYISLNKNNMAYYDLMKVLELDPTNQRCISLLKDIKPNIYQHIESSSITD